MDEEQIVRISWGLREEEVQEDYRKDGATILPLINVAGMLRRMNRQFS